MRSFEAVFGGVCVCMAVLMVPSYGVVCGVLVECVDVVFQCVGCG